MNRNRKRGGEHDEFYALWAFQHSHCQACGVSEHQAVRLNGGVPLSTHHLIGGVGRSHEACNLIRLCLTCHDLAEGKERVDSSGVRRSPLSTGQMLALKLDREPEEFNLARLAELTGHAVEVEQVPEWLSELYFANRPWERELRR